MVLQGREKLTSMCADIPQKYFKQNPMKVALTEAMCENPNGSNIELKRKDN